MSNFLNQTKYEEIMEGDYDRPMGVSLLSALMIISSVVLLISQVTAFKTLIEASSILGVSNVFFQGALGFLGLLGVVGGVGMWLGKKWGWWLAMFYFAYSMTRNVNVIISIQGISDQFGMSGQDIGVYYLKYGIRALWNGILLFYMCRENATVFFNTMETKKWKALLIVFAICAAIFVIGSLLSLL